MAKSNFDRKMKKVSAEFDKVADEVKDTAGEVQNRWTSSKTEEKISMIVGIFLLICALIELKSIVWWVILLALWLLAISGFFDSFIYDIIKYFKKETKSKKTISSTAKPANKKTNKK